MEQDQPINGCKRGLVPGLVALFAGGLVLLLIGGGPVFAAASSVGLPPLAVGESNETGLEDDFWYDDPWEDEARDAGRRQTLADPLEPLNRFFFVVNDRLYYWALEPVSRGYARVLPEDVRLSLRRFFRNLSAPVRVANHLLQGQLPAAGTELARFVINSTIGIAGLADPAAGSFGLAHRSADLGQTLGVYGFGDGFYINWPVLGPSTLRDSVGLAGDSFINPFAQITSADPRVGAALYGTRVVNTVSVHLGEYERVVETAFDPYLALRDAYWQYRRNQVRGLGEGVKPAIFSEAGRHDYSEHVVPFPAAGEGGEFGLLAGVKEMVPTGAASLQGEILPASAEQDLPAARELAECPGTGFFIHVGAFVDRQLAAAAATDLGAVARDACLVAHLRADYHFYGLMIPAGQDFPAAKERERQLADDGADGWLVTSFSR